MYSGDSSLSKKYRKHKRYARRYPVRFAWEETRIFGFTIDFSSGGLGISAKKGINPPGQLDMRLTVPTGEIPLKGRVRWCRKAARTSAQMFVFEMGVQLTERSQEYIDLLETMIDEMEDRQHAHDFHEDLHVTYETQYQLLQEYDANIRHDGLFIPTDQVFENMQEVNFSIHLLELMAVLHGVGRVIYRVSPEDAANSDKVAGIGIQIQQFLFGDQEDLHLMIEELRAKHRRHS